MCQLNRKYSGKKLLVLPPYTFPSLIHSFPVGVWVTNPWPFRHFRFFKGENGTISLLLQDFFFLGNLFIPFSKKKQGSPLIYSAPRGKLLAGILTVVSNKTHYR